MGASNRRQIFILSFSLVVVMLWFRLVIPMINATNPRSVPVLSG